MLYQSNFFDNRNYYLIKKTTTLWRISFNVKNLMDWINIKKIIIIIILIWPRSTLIWCCCCHGIIIRIKGIAALTVADCSQLSTATFQWNILSVSWDWGDNPLIKCSWKMNDLSLSSDSETQSLNSSCLFTFYASIFAISTGKSGNNQSLPKEKRKKKSSSGWCRF